MKPLVFQSDFGTVDGAVSAMYGVAYGVDPGLVISNLTHEITPYDIWEASYRLIQTVSYWPQGTVFVSVVDPGVGSTRRSIAVETNGGHYIITPDNGTLTHVKRMCGIRAARIIDESTNRLQGSGESYTFHGRDIYAFTGARLAAGVITFEQVGPAVEVDSVIELPVVPSLRATASAAPSMCWTSGSAVSGPTSPGSCSSSWGFPTEAAWKSASRMRPGCSTKTS